MKKIAGAFLMVCAPLAVSATELSHDFLEAGVARRTESLPSWLAPDRDFDGGYVRGSVSITQGLYAFGGYRSGSSDELGYDLDDSDVHGGVGYAHAIGQRAELIAEASLIRRQLDDFGYDDDGQRLSAGVRAVLAERVEGWAKASYTNGFASGRYSGQVGGMYRFGETWGVTGEVDVESDSRTFSLGLRKTF